MQKIEQIKQAIEQADRLSSKLEGPVLEVPSFTSLKIRHLLNNLGAISKNYLEVGSHRGGHLCSVIYKNKNLDRAVAVDNYSEFNQGGKTKQDLLDNFFKFAPEGGIHFHLIEEDCFTINERLVDDFYDFYNYDALHTESAQQRAVSYFLPKLKNEFIFVVDDWSFNGVEQGTRTGIKLAGLKVLGEWIMRTPEGGEPNEHWHNDFAVFYLQK